MNSRRQFLRYLAASPLFPYLDLPAAWFSGRLRSQPAQASRWQGSQDEDLIASVKDAVNVFDFEPVARKKLPPAHFGYLATGTDDDGTIKANRDGFSRYSLRMRRLIDVSRIDMSVGLLGVNWDTPIVLCPVGSQKAFHPEGEIAVGLRSDGVVYELHREAFILRRGPRSAARASAVRSARLPRSIAEFQGTARIPTNHYRVVADFEDHRAQW